MFLSDFIYNFLSLLPDRCPYCNKIIDKKETACKKCKAQFPTFTATRFAKGGFYCCSPFFYSGIYKCAVRQMKFNGKASFAEKLVYPMSTALNKAKEKVDFDYVTCVPMHKNKFYERGYNQAELLARNLSTLIDVPYLDTLDKIRETKDQHKCDRNERSLNVKGAFRTKNSSLIRKKKVLIVDDIITSGYTLGECCKTLSKSGVHKICCVTVCATNR